MVAIMAEWLGYSTFKWAFAAFFACFLALAIIFPYDGPPEANPGTGQVVRIQYAGRGVIGQGRTFYVTEKEADIHRQVTKWILGMFVVLCVWGVFVLPWDQMGRKRT